MAALTGTLADKTRRTLRLCRALALLWFARLLILMVKTLKL